MATKTKKAAGKKRGPYKLRQYKHRKAPLDTAGCAIPADVKNAACEIAEVPYEKDRRKMNPSEALVSLFGFLTTREKPIIFSQYHDCAPIFELIDAFRKYHKLAPPRDGMNKGTYLPGLDHITNEPTNLKLVGTDPATVLKSIWEQLYKIGERDQNKVIAKLLQEVKAMRQQRHDYALKMQKGASIDETASWDQLNEFNNIVSGNFTVL